MKTRTIFETPFDSQADKRVDSIRVVWTQDKHADSSHLGAYSNDPEAGAIDRKARGDMRRNEYRYFNPCRNYDECTLEDKATYTEQDYQRAEKLNAGDWCYMGCRVVATVSYPSGNGHRRLQEFSSCGLWGIESDSNADHVAEVEAHEIADLVAHLEQFEIAWPETVNA